MPEYIPSRWGDEITNASYSLLMAASNPADKPILLEQHAVNSVSAERVDALFKEYFELVNGENRPRRKVLRRGFVQGWTWNLVHGLGAIWTPSLQLSRGATAQETRDFYFRFNCPSNDDAAHAWIYPESVVDESEPLVDPVVSSGGEVLSEQSPVNSPRRLLIYNPKAYERVTVSSVPMYAVAFMTSDCNSAEAEPYSAILAAGGDGAGDITLLRSYDRFATYDTLDTSIVADGSLPSDLYTEGNLIIMPWTDAALATAAAGGIAVSVDRGESVVAATLPASPGPIWGVTKFGNTYIAVGGATGAQATMFESTDGKTWTAVSNANLPATSALLAIDANPDTGEAFAVGEDGTCLKITISANAFAITVLDPTDTGDEDLHSVKVFGVHKGSTHVSVGGASGFYAESVDGGATWTEPPTTAGGSDVVRAIGGDRVRAAIGAATALAFRDILTSNEYEDKTLEDGATIGGSIWDISSGRDNFNGFNYFAAVTNAANGEIIVCQPPTPQN